MQIDSKLLDRIIKSLGNFIWLGNNLHNIFTPEFKRMFLDSVAEAREVYNILEGLK